MIDIASACVGVLIVRDIPLSRRHNQGREGGSHKELGKADSHPSKQSEAKAALLSMYSRVMQNTDRF